MNHRWELLQLPGLEAPTSGEQLSLPFTYTPKGPTHDQPTPQPAPPRRTLLGGLLVIFAARRARNARHKATIAALNRAETEGLEPMTPAELRIISLALEDRARNFAGTPAGVAAENARAKIARNMIR